VLEAHEFLESRPSKGIPINRFFGTRDRTKRDSIVFVESDFWGEIVIKEEERPRGSLTLFKWSKSVCGKTKSDIAWI
jgi:hypothetical protein